MGSQSVEMLQVVTFSSLALLLSGVTSQQCIDFTTKDVEGPFFVSNVPLKYKVAPDADIQEPSQGAIIRGRILNKNCEGIAGATVDVWYAGGSDPRYSFRPSVLQNRGYEFLGSFPGTYNERPIVHIHYKVVTGGPQGQTFITQLYFRGQVPPAYQNYVKTRGSQFGQVQAVAPGNSELPNGGRRIIFNIRLDQ